VQVPDLGLSQRELEIFREMVGPRLNPGKQKLTLTSERFTNRVENKRYLIYLLENLLAESRRLAIEESSLRMLPKSDDKIQE
jgi:hypothetical protein